MLRLAALLILLGHLAAYAAEAQPGVGEFNVKCPAPKLLPLLDAAFHECNKGFVNGSCGRFVETLEQLVPKYDCQRPFDATADKQYTVPAIWLAGDGALEDYIALLARMASGKDKMFKDKSFTKDSAAARKLFMSREFARVLDGHMAEEYGPLVEELRKGGRK
jgi:hypothetical protein